MNAEPVPSPATILCVVGARPNFMKIAPVMAALAACPGLRGYLVHTGQHYDVAMSAGFFAELGIPEPDENLEVGSGSHAQQTAEVMRRFEPVLDRVRPAAVLVVGDVNSTIACALVAVKKGIAVAHVEAGLRSWNRAMPEEINRVLTDQISDFLFTTEQGALPNLLREGIAAERVHFVGNVMIDTLRANLARATPPRQSLIEAGAAPGLAEDPRGYQVLTLHRPSNVDDRAVLSGLLTTVRDISARCPVVFTVHPRTRARIAEFGLDRLLGGPDIAVIPPQGYLAMLGLMAGARAVLTDSGGIQEETTALGVPCFTLREDTERPITIEEGTNTLVGPAPAAILAAFDRLLATGGKTGRIPALWDGRAAERIAGVLAGAFVHPD
ncbi:MAG: UDP-N-acetylglucosamine 2-epimerase (non-hydrolyzing) [Candidatus Hydrogenedens sp.]|nr:UDP-N-acetylglucosamine 2-epimerase (non-hydrolyzing) [Candidatus Hydrogenedens sp.]